MKQNPFFAYFTHSKTKWARSLVLPFCILLVVFFIFLYKSLAIGSTISSKRGFGFSQFNTLVGELGIKSVFHGTTHKIKILKHKRNVQASQKVDSIPTVSVIQPSCHSGPDSGTITFVTKGFLYSIDSVNFSTDSSFGNLLPGVYYPTVMYKDASNDTFVTRALRVRIRPATPDSVVIKVLPADCIHDSARIVFLSPLDPAYKYSFYPSGFQYYSYDTVSHQVPDQNLPIQVLDTVSNCLSKTSFSDTFYVHPTRILSLGQSVRNPNCTDTIFGSISINNPDVDSVWFYKVTSDTIINLMAQLNRPNNLIFDSLPADSSYLIFGKNVDGCFGDTSKGSKVITRFTISHRIYAPHFQIDSFIIKDPRCDTLGQVTILDSNLYNFMAPVYPYVIKDTGNPAKPDTLMKKVYQFTLNNFSDSSSVFYDTLKRPYIIQPPFDTLNFNISTYTLQYRSDSIFGGCVFNPGIPITLSNHHSITPRPPKVSLDSPTCARDTAIFTVYAPLNSIFAYVHRDSLSKWYAGTFDTTITPKVSQQIFLHPFIDSTVFDTVRFFVYSLDTVCRSRDTSFRLKRVKPYLPRFKVHQPSDCGDSAFSIVLVDPQDSLNLKYSVFNVDSGKYIIPDTLLTITPGIDTSNNYYLRVLNVDSTCYSDSVKFSANRPFYKPIKPFIDSVIQPTCRDTLGKIYVTATLDTALGLVNDTLIYYLIKIDQNGKRDTLRSQQSPFFDTVQIGTYTLSVWNKRSPFVVSLPNGVCSLDTVVNINPPNIPSEPNVVFGNTKCIDSSNTATLSLPFATRDSIWYSTTFPGGQKPYDTLHLYNVKFQPGITDTIFVTDTTTGCHQFYPISVPPPFIPTAIINFCSGFSSLLSADSANLGTLFDSLHNTFVWTLNNKVISNAVYDTLTAKAVGDYVVIVTNDSTKCVSFSNVQTIDSLGLKPLPPAINGFNNLCSDSSILSSVQPAPNGGGYQWYLNDTAITGANQSTYVVHNVGVYSVQYVSGTCISVKSNKINVTQFLQKPILSLTNAGDSNLCTTPAGTTVITASPNNNGSTYTWYQNGTYTGISGTNNQLLASNVGSYYVSDSAGQCPIVYSDTITLNKSGLKKPTISGVLYLCNNGGQTSLYSSDKGNFNQWFFEGAAVTPGGNNDSLVVNQVGHYNVQLINNSTGCSSPLSDTAFVAQTIPDPIIVGNPNFCLANTTVLSDSTISIGNQWYKNGIPVAGSTGQTITLTPKDIGAYYVKVTIGQCPIKTSDTIIVTKNLVNPVIKVLSNGGDTSLCFINNATLGVSTTAQTLQWYYNGGIVTGQTNNTLNVNKAGTYYVQASSGAICTAPSNTITITQYTPKPIILGDTDLCTAPNGVSLLTSSDKTDTIIANIQYGNHWYKNGLYLNYIDSVYPATSTGKYFVSFTTPYCSTVNSDTLTVVTNNFKPVISGNPYLCNLGTTVLYSSVKGLQYQWTLNGAPLVTKVGINNDSLIVSVAGNYQVLVVNNNNVPGCQAAQSDVYPVLNAPTSSQITPKNPNFCLSDTIKLTSVFTTGNQWYRNNLPLTDSVGQTITLTIKDTGNSYFVSTKFGQCQNVNSDTVTVTQGFVIPKLTVGLNGDSSLCFVKNTFLSVPVGTAQNYQWYDANGILPGDTNNSLIISKPGGIFYVVASIGHCMDTSNLQGIIDSIPKPHIFSVVGNNICTTTDGTVLLKSTDSIVFPNFGNNWHLIGLAPVLSQSASYLVINSPGQYYVTFTSPYCNPINSDTFSVVRNQLPTPVVSGFPSLCNGNKTTLYSSSTVGNQWYKDGVPVLVGGNADSLVVTQVGNYTVSVSLNSVVGCNSSMSLPYPVSLLPVPPVITGATNFCNSDTIVLSSNYSTGNQWYKNGVLKKDSVGQSITLVLNDTNTGIGNYYVTSSYGVCAVTQSNILSITNGLLKPIIQVGTTGNGDTTLCFSKSVLLTVTNVANTNYQWYNGTTTIPSATSNIFSVTQPGNYYVVESLGKNCSDTSNSQSIISSLPKPIIMGDSNLCYTVDGTTTLTSSNKTVVAGYGNFWYKNTNGRVLTNDTAYYVDNSPGNYYIILKSPYCSPVTSDTFKIVQYIPTPFINGKTYLCDNGLAILKANISSQFVGNYRWFYNTSIDSIVRSNSGDTLQTNTTGLYAVEGYNAICTSKRSPNLLVSNNLPTPIITGEHFICQGSSTILYSSTDSGYTYQWYFNGNPITGANDSTLKVTNFGNYTVLVAKGEACSSIQSNPFNVGLSNVGAPPVPNITAIGNTVFCDGGSVTLKTDATQNIQWFLNGNPITNIGDTQTIIANKPGQYVVNVTNLTNHCISSSSSTNIVVNPKPSLAGLTVISPSVCIVNTGSIIFNPLGSNYLYSIDGGFETTSPVFQNVLLGFHTLKVRNISTNCESDTSGIEIKTPTGATPLVQLSDSTQPSCTIPTGTVTIKSPLGSNFQYSYDGGQSFFSSTVSPPLNPGTIGIIVKDNSTGCIGPVRYITLNPSPGPSSAITKVTSQPLCSTDKGNIEIVSPIGAYFYSLDGGNYQQGLDFSNLSVGSHVISVKDTISGCLSTPIPFNLNSKYTSPKVPTFNLPTCANGFYDITISNPDPTYLYSLNSGAFSQTLHYNLGVDQTYTITVKNANGCTSETFFTVNHCISDLSIQLNVTPNTNVSINNKLNLVFTASNLGSNNATGVTVTDTLNNTSLKVDPSTLPSNVTFDINSRILTWKIDSLNANEVKSISFEAKVVSGGFITDTVYISGNEFDPNLSNNIAFIDPPIKVENELFIPNIITPNGDGLNDKFVILGLDKYPGSELLIFNRWESQVYYSGDYKNEWDGGIYATGTYYYVLKLHDNGQVRIIKGYVTVMK